METGLIVEMAVHIAGQDLGGRGRRADDQIVVNNGMGHLMGQYSLMEIGDGYIYGVELKYIPCPIPSFLFIDTKKGVFPHWKRRLCLFFRYSFHTPLYGFKCRLMNNLSF